MSKELEEILNKLYEDGVNNTNHKKVFENMHKTPDGIYQGYEPALKAKQSIQAYILGIIGEDEERKVEDWGCPCGTNHHLETSYHQRNELRAEQRLKLKGDIDDTL